MSDFCEFSVLMLTGGSNPPWATDTTLDATVRILTLCTIIPPSSFGERAQSRSSVGGSSYVLLRR